VGKGLPASAAKAERELAEVHHHDDRDEGPEEGEELALGDEVGLAGLVDELGDLEHRPVHRQLLEMRRDEEAEDQAGEGDRDSDQQEVAALHAQEGDRSEIGQDQAGLAAAGRAGRGKDEQRRDGMQVHGRMRPPAARQGFELESPRLPSSCVGSPRSGRADTT
jgi:hypothetical protein